ncbi:MAG: DUF5011 domain-containing protein, partial [Clostridiales bacterium]|nr:DUF5011 domain-containing protein [Clostridiales bacterium]
AKVINISLAFTADSITLKNAIDNAYSKGCAIFAASGNESRNTIPYPARYSNVMAVGSSGDGKTRIASSNYGEGMGVVAFASYYSISSAGGYVGVGGTSISTPQVSGLASLIWAVNPDLTNSQVYRLIEQGAKPLGGGYNLETGYGLIDCGKTLAMALETVGPPQYTTPPVITLNGLIEVTLEEGNAYIEPGCTAQDCLGVDITAQVNVSGSVNTSVPGAYTITYEVTDAGGNTTRVTRTVTVVAVVPQYNTPPVITLKGMENITIEEGNTYIEPGYTATDCLGVDITVQVIVSGSVNTSVPGNYTITYKVTDAGDNTTSVTRTVTVTEIIPVLSPPALNLIGANPIILHLGGSAYIEQGALAYDDADGNISGLVQITGGPDTNHSGTYTVTYRVVNSAGLEAVATRQVRVLAPIVTTLPRTSYNFTGQGKVPTTVTHNGIVAEAAGFMDLNITNLSGKMSITVKLVNIDTGAIAFSNTYSTEGVRQFFVDPGRYNLVVTIDSGNGNCNYKLTLLMPEVVIWTFELPETPQGGSYTAYAGPIYQAA